MLEPQQAPQVYLRDDGILVIDYGLCEHLTLWHIEVALEQHLQIIVDPVPVLILSHSPLLRVDRDAEKFASSPQVVAHVTATAMIADSFIKRHLAKLYTFYSAPPYPAAFFATQQQAVEWLQQYR